jgi:hypothetical protein
MNLPEGVQFGTGRERLITKGEPGWIEIDEGALGWRDYVIKHRSFGQAIAPYLHGDWAEFDQCYRLATEGVIYSGADYGGRPVLPNITVLPNLRVMGSDKERGAARAMKIEDDDEDGDDCGRADEGGVPDNEAGMDRPTVFGCTMGHWHPREAGGDWSQEIYEFQGYGLMVLDREGGEVEVWVMRDGDKVTVPNGSHMTLYNLGDADHPLVTLDFANPDHNPANKDLIRSRGPILLAYYNDSEVFFVLNHLYINSPDSQAGVRMACPPQQLRERQIRIGRKAGLEVGRQVYEQLTQDTKVPGQFARLGLRLRMGAPETTLVAKTVNGEKRCALSGPLVQAVRPGSEGYRFFMGPTGD